MDPAAIVISPEMVKIVPEALARRLVAVPVSREDATLTVAISDPLNVTAFDVLEQATRLQ
ncbi:MAG: type II secretion system protein GspE, partial [Verrucomicrobia bacterium]|nr:type II secretion system protein GspE [Verrucomicrobiota bacterium]